MNPSVDFRVIQKAAEPQGLDPLLLSAIVAVESSWNPWAVRFEPGWKYFWFPREVASRLRITEETERVLQACSWGLPQIMGAVAREYGFKGELHQLWEPELSLKYACLHLKKFNQKYVEEADVIAAYNAGSARREKTGMYVNQRYVDKVYQELLKLRKLA